MTTDTTLPCADDLAALVAIVRAAHIAGDRRLERAARRELAERYGVDISIRRERQERGAPNAE